MTKNGTPQSDIARLGSFNTPGQAGPAGSEVQADPFMSFIAPNQAQQSHLTPQSLQASARRSGQNHTALAANALKQQGARAQNANAAALAGFFAGDGNRKLNQEQINQFMAMGVAGNIPAAAAGISAGLPPNPNPVSLAQGQASRALTTQMLQQMRAHQNAGMQGANVATNPSYVARATRAATGMSVSQMKALMAQSHNGTTEGMRGAQDLYGNFDRNRHAAQAAAAAAAANQRTEQPGAAGSEEFWGKLEEMKLKYREPLQKMYQFTQIIANGQRPDRKDQFKKHLKDCFQILELSRGNPVPSTLTTALLDKACKFLDSVINVYKNIIVKEQQNANSNASRQHQGAASGSQASRYAMMQGAAAGPQNAGLHNAQSHQDLFMKMHQQQQQQFNQQQSAAATAMNGVGGHISDATKEAVKAAVGRIPNRGQPMRGSRQAQLAQAAHIAMSIKSEQAGVVPSHGISPGNMTEDQKLIFQRNAALLQARSQQAGQQQQYAQQQHAAAAAAAAGLHRGAAAQQGSAQAATAATGVNRMMANNLQLKQMQMRKYRQGQLSNAGGAGEVGGVGASNGAAQVYAGQLPIKTEAANAMIGRANAPAGGGVAAPTVSKNTEVILEQRLTQMSDIVKALHDNTHRWEQAVESEMKRGKAERIQNTLAALRNVNSTSALVSGVGDKRRSSSLVDVENCKEGDGIIRSKSVFECSSEQGLRLAKRPKNDAADLKSVREAVEADCKAAQERNPLLSLNIYEEFGQPVVECMLLIEEIKLPKLVLRVQRGYPRKGGATYGFERPPLGWVGVLATIRARFKRCLANAPATSVGVAAFLDAWAREAESVVDTELRGSCTDVAESDEEVDCQVKPRVAGVMETVGA